MFSVYVCMYKYIYGVFFHKQIWSFEYDVQILVHSNLNILINIVEIQIYNK